MIALLTKDLRLYRAAFIAAGIGIVAPFLLEMIALIYGALDHPAVQLYGILDLTRIFAVLASMIVAAIFGGSAFSIERRDRSGEFLAMLPINRWYIMLSKFLVPLPALFSIWVIHGSAFFLLTDYQSPNRRVLAVSGEGIQLISYVLCLAAMILVFGIAWLIGLFLRSTAVSASIALAVLLAGGFLVGLLFTNPDEGVRPEPYFFLFAMVMGVLCFLIGIACYVKRVSP
jgi:ABC-type transport system involved in multi-copper enzyme maturation permease subunit